jgi:hypothetical protein
MKSKASGEAGAFVVKDENSEWVFILLDIIAYLVVQGGKQSLHSKNAADMATICGLWP